MKSLTHICYSRIIFLLRRFIILTVIWCWSGLIAIHANDTRPVAALTFVFDGDVHIATFDDSGLQSVTELPDFMLFGRYDIRTITPAWTPDGRLIGTGYDPQGDFTEEPKYETPAIYLKTYDIHSHEFTAFDDPITSPLAAPTDASPPLQILAMNSLSPAGDYAIFFDSARANSYLVDVNTNETLFAYPPCGFKALIWEPERVLIGNHGAFNDDCTPAILMWIDLKTGKIDSDLSQIIVEQPIYQFDYALSLSANQLLVVTDNSDERLLALIDDATFQTITPMQGNLIAPDESGMAFWHEGDYNYMMLQQPFSQDAIGSFEPDDILRLVFPMANSVRAATEKRDEDDDLVMSRVVYMPDTGISLSEIFYDGEVPRRRAFAPKLDYAAVLNDDESLIVFDASGQPVWEHSDIPLMDDLYWADDQRIAAQMADYAGSLVGDLESGTVVLPPEPGAQLINISPDGRWWLYLVPVSPDYQFEFRGHRLIVRDHTTDEVHIIKDALADDDTARLLLNEANRFIWWSPPDD